MLERIKELRIEHNLTQKNISEILNVSRSVYNLWELEIETIPRERLLDLCKYYNVSLDYVFGFTNKKLYNNCNYNINKSVIGLRFKDFRKENKLTLTLLANILDTSPSTLHAYENTKNIIPVFFLYIICFKYRISADYLLGKVDSPKYLN